MPGMISRSLSLKPRHIHLPELKHRVLEAAASMEIGSVAWH